MHAEKRINMGNRIAQNVIIKSVKKFWNEEDGMGVLDDDNTYWYVLCCVYPRYRPY